MRLDTAMGMAFSQIIMWAIITTAAGSLHAHNITDIQSADQAAASHKAKLINHNSSIRLFH
jgi:hypothetical protein